MRWLIILFIFLVGLSILFWYKLSPSRKVEQSIPEVQTYNQPPSSGKIIYQKFSDIPILDTSNWLTYTKPNFTGLNIKYPQDFKITNLDDPVHHLYTLLIQNDKTSIQLSNGLVGALRGDLKPEVIKIGYRYATAYTLAPGSDQDGMAYVDVEDGSLSFNATVNKINHSGVLSEADIALLKTLLYNSTPTGN